MERALAFFPGEYGALTVRKNRLYDWVYTSQADPLATLSKSSSARKRGESSSGTGGTGALPIKAAADAGVFMSGEFFKEDPLVPCAKSLESVATAEVRAGTRLSETPVPHVSGGCHQRRRLV